MLEEMDRQAIEAIFLKNLANPHSKISATDDLNPWIDKVFQIRNWILNGTLRTEKPNVVRINKRHSNLRSGYFTLSPKVILYDENFEVNLYTYVRYGWTVSSLFGHLLKDINYRAVIELENLMNIPKERLAEIQKYVEDHCLDLEKQKDQLILEYKNKFSARDRKRFAKKIADFLVEECPNIVELDPGGMVNFLRVTAQDAEFALKLFKFAKRNRSWSEFVENDDIEEALKLLDVHRVIES